MNAHGIAVYLQSDPGAVDMVVCLEDNAAVEQFCGCLRRAASLSAGSWVEGPTFASPRDPLYGIQLARIGDGKAERVELSCDAAARAILRWQGDSEYWLECAEKCEALTGGGFNYLMMRGPAEQSITVCYGSRFPQA